MSLRIRPFYFFIFSFLFFLGFFTFLLFWCQPEQSGGVLSEGSQTEGKRVSESILMLQLRMQSRSGYCSWEMPDQQ